MGDRLNNFDLKLLTASKEVGLRRLRSYSAALGAGAQIFNTWDDLRRNVESAFNGCRANIVLHDNSVPLTPAQVHELQRFSRVFILQRPEQDNRVVVPANGAPCWDVESYMQCSLAAFLDSPVVRMSMAQMCKAGQPFHLNQLLRWGHAVSTWNKNPRTEVDDASYAFVKNLSLAGEGRRLAEMFTHFLVSSLPGFGVTKESVTFGADGLLVTVIATCQVGPEFPVRDLVEELRINAFPISVVNRLADGRYEVGALFYPFHMQSFRHEKIVMVFNKVLDTAAASVEAPIEKAG